MLDHLPGAGRALRFGGDPVAGFTVLLLGLGGVGLLSAAVLAVNDYALPSAEGPVVFGLGLILLLILGLNLVAAGVRAWRRVER